MTTSPPLSPTLSYRENGYYSHHTHTHSSGGRRRSSSFSSNHDRSPVTPRSKHRFSNASIGSNDLHMPGGGGEGSGGGLGNLADELEDLEDEEDDLYEEEEDGEGDVEGEEGEVLAKESRDSGVDVSYSHAAADSSPVARGKHVRNFSKPFGSPGGGGGGEGGRLPDGYEAEESLSRDLEELMGSVARMANSSSTTASSTSQSTSATASEDPLISRTIALLQDLGNQTAIEQGTSRLNTSTNSMTAHLTSQTKSLQSLAASLYKPFGAAAYFPPTSTTTTTPSLDPSTMEETLSLLDTLISELPHPDTAPLHGLQKLSRETDNVIQTLSQLTDTLQMGKQATSAAARHLRTTQTIVAELRRERERADDARLALSSAGARAWEEKVRGKWCRNECEDVVRGFEGVCDSLRGRLEEAAAVGGGGGVVAA